MNKLFLFVVGAAVLMVGGASWQALASDSALTAQMTEVHDSEAAQVMGGAPCYPQIRIDNSPAIPRCGLISKIGSPPTRCPKYGRAFQGFNYIYNWEPEDANCMECSIACGTQTLLRKCLITGSEDPNGSWESIPYTAVD